MSKIMYIGLFALGSLAAHAEFNEQEFKQAKSCFENSLFKEIEGIRIPTKVIIERITYFYRLLIEDMENAEDENLFLIKEGADEAYFQSKERLSEIKQVCNDNHLTILFQPFEDAMTAIYISNGDISVIRQAKEKLKVCLHILETN